MTSVMSCLSIDQKTVDSLNWQNLKDLNSWIRSHNNLIVEEVDLTEVSKQEGLI